ncbi:hypothetical protein Q9295_09130 [Xinfangfangia sp. CPCC 101601]|uniref:Uncharacterized protein n=1 Tax=Pseudogemmobacter lacusdianii TaxID=3069608 RepID=A0ABU0VXQ0_9RHOB|nr:hypothetical protein [Xinfangfangia sp. CPCC 101601]MDQ2066536.1 hypothetical protein [Xinfangfangia sp. CPCC 101601]
MDISLNFERPEQGPSSGPVSVGWFLTSDKGAVLFDPPERVSQRQTNRAHAKSASRCPAVIQLESRYFMVKCPFDLHIGFGRDDKGKPVLINRAGAASSIRSNKLGEVLTLVNESEWRYPDRPTVQLQLPYCFIADEMVFVTQLSAFLHYRPDPLPGTIFGGRFPISIWPRPLMWAFEWHEPGKDIVLRRGEPLFYCQFEATDPSRPVQLVEAEKTADLEAYLEKIGGVVNYVNQTFSLFKAAEALRPKKLLTPKPRD